LQDSPQIDDTSLTHCESHFVLQQYGSWLQMLPAHASHVLDSLLPEAQIECAQVEPPPPQDWPQIEATSPTQMLSHAVVQQ